MLLSIASIENSYYYFVIVFFKEITKFLSQTKFTKKFNQSLKKWALVKIKVDKVFFFEVQQSIKSFISMKISCKNQTNFNVIFWF